MDDDIEIADLFGTDSWEAIEAQHAAFVQEAEATVDRWVAAPVHADWEGPYLLWTVREGRAPYDKPLAKEPEDWGRAVSYGMRADGSVAIARRFQMVAGRPRLDLETIWIDRGGRPVQLRSYHRYGRSASSHEAAMLRVAIRLWEDGRQVGVKTWPDGRGGGLDGGFEIEAYTYTDGRITEIVSDRRSANYPQHDRRLRWPITYGADGGITRIEAHDEPPIEDIAPRVLYVRSDAAAARTAREAINTAMPETIVAWARRVAPVLDATPAELMDDATLRELFAILEHQWQEKDDMDGLPRLLLAVAKRMATADWPSLLPSVSQDFVVALPLDRDERLIEQSLRNSVPANMRKRLMRTLS
jgi:hypothetical protein